MFIQTERTPNPETLKFIPGCRVMETGVAEFKTPESAASGSALADRFFKTGKVTEVFFGSDFISITKTTDTDWEDVKTPFLALIMDHFMAGWPLLTETHESKPLDTSDDDILTAQIRELLDTRVRPAVAMDGGDVVFDRFEQGIVYLKMRGACSGCPSSTATLKHGIESMLRHYVPEVLEVRQSAD